MIRTENERVAKAARSFFSYGRWVRCGGLSEPLTGLAAASWLRSRLGEVSYPKNHTPSDLASLGHLPQRGRQGCGVDGRTANSRPYGVRRDLGPLPPTALRLPSKREARVRRGNQKQEIAQRSGDRKRITGVRVWQGMSRMTVLPSIRKGTSARVPSGWRA